MKVPLPKELSTSSSRKKRSGSGYVVQNVFDVVLDLDARECTEKLVEIYDYTVFGDLASISDAKCGGGKCVIS